MNFCPTWGCGEVREWWGWTRPFYVKEAGPLKQGGGALWKGGAFELRRRRGYGNIAEASVWFWEHDSEKKCPISYFSFLTCTDCTRVTTPTPQLSCTDYKMLYYFVQLYWKRVKNLLVDLCALIMAVPVNEADTFVFDCAVQLDVTPVSRRDCGWGPTL